MLAFKSALGCQDCLDELALGAITEFVIEAFDAGIAQAKGFAQCQMEFRIAGKALEVVKNNDIALLRLRIEIAEQRHHAGALHKITATRRIVGKDRVDGIALRLGILTAAGFLALQPMAFLGLFCTGNAAVNDSTSSLFVQLSML